MVQRRTTWLLHKSLRAHYRYGADLAIIIQSNPSPNHLRFGCVGVVKTFRWQTPMQKFILTTFLFLFCGNFASGQDADIIATVKQHLPANWTGELRSYQGNAFAEVTTDEMETIPSISANAAPGVISQRLTIRIKLLPRFSPAMLRRITEFNAPLEKKLESLEFGSAEYSEVSRNLIDTPTFQNATCGIRVEYLSRVPKSKESIAAFQTFLTAISKDWQPVSGDAKPAETLVGMLTR